MSRSLPTSAKNSGASTPVPGYSSGRNSPLKGSGGGKLTKSDINKLSARLMAIIGTPKTNLEKKGERLQ